MRKAIIISFCIAMNASFAAQIKTVKNYDEVCIHASITEPNTILLEEDRIQQMKAPGNTLIDACNGKPNCKLIDEVTGALTFIPSPLYHTRAFTINLFTEKGHFYNVRVEPKPIASQTVLLKSYQKPVIQARFPKGSAYEQTLLRFFRELVNGRIPEGFTQTIPKKPKIFKGHYTQLKLLLTISGNELQGEVFELTNTSKHPIEVKESWLNWYGTKGIAVAERHLLPFKTTRVYRISTYVH